MISLCVFHFFFVFCCPSEQLRLDSEEDNKWRGNCSHLGQISYTYTFSFLYFRQLNLGRNTSTRRYLWHQPHLVSVFSPQILQVADFVGLRNAVTDTIMLPAFLCVCFADPRSWRSPVVKRIAHMAVDVEV